MGQALHTLGIDSMSVEDRIALAQDIWDSVAIEAGLLPPSPSDKAEIDRRLAEDDAVPMTRFLGIPSSLSRNHAGKNNASGCFSSTGAPRV